MFYRIIAAFFIFFIFIGNAFSYEITELQMLHLKTGIHQASPYNDKLQVIDYLGYKKPLAGCVPLSIARVLAYYTGNNSTDDYQNLIENIHINSSNYIQYQPNWTSVQSKNIKYVTLNEGYELDDLDFLALKKNSSDSWRERVSKTYVWVKKKIDKKIPVIAVSQAGSHAFIIDGYAKVDPDGYAKEDLYFHILLGQRYSNGNISDAKWMRADQKFFRSFTDVRFFDAFWQDDVYFYTIEKGVPSTTDEFSLKANKLNNSGFYAMNTKHRWGDGSTQDFKKYGSSEQAAIMQSNFSYKAYIVGGDIWRKYAGLDGMSNGAGGATGKLGYPISEEYDSTFWGYSVRKQDFIGGSIVWISSGRFFGFTRAQEYNGNVIADWSIRSYQ